MRADDGDSTKITYASMDQLTSEAAPFIAAHGPVHVALFRHDENGTISATVGLIETVEALKTYMEAATANPEWQ
jgi:hypothetical protein